MLDAANWLSMTTDPPNIDWSLARDNVLYVSSDKGKSWKKVRVQDEQSSQEAVLNDQIENSKTVRDAVCGTEELNGVAHEIVEATYDTLQNFKFESRVKYWVDPTAKRPVKATFAMKGEGFENFSTQLISLAPEFQLPNALVRILINDRQIGRKVFQTPQRSLPWPTDATSLNGRPFCCRTSRVAYQGSLTGACRIDNFFVLRPGMPWTDLPERYGPYSTVYNRFDELARNEGQLWVKSRLGLLSVDCRLRATRRH